MLKDKLAKLRKAKRMTQEDLAKRSGVSRNSITNWETGKREPKLIDIEKLAKVLNVSPNDFLDETHEVNSKSSASKTHEIKTKGYSYWGEVLDEAKNVAKNRNTQEIAIITPLLRSALDILLSAQGHMATVDDAASGVSAFNGNHSSYNGNTVSVGAQG